MSNILLGVILAIIAFLLWFVSQKGYVKNATLDRLDKIASIMAFAAAIGSFALASTNLSSTTKFEYQVYVRDQKTGEAIKNAEVSIEFSNQAPQNVFTDSNGLARIFVDNDWAYRPALLRISMTNYESFILNIDLVEHELPKVIQIKPYNISIDTCGTLFPSVEEAETYYEQAEIYYTQQNYDSAIKECKCAIIINPNYILAYELMAVAYKSKGNHILARFYENEATKRRIRSNRQEPFKSDAPL